MFVKSILVSESNKFYDGISSYIFFRTVKIESKHTNSAILALKVLVATTDALAHFETG